MNKDQNNQNNGQETTEEQKGAISMRKKISARWAKFKATKGGKWAVRGGKLVLGGLALGGAYEAGRRSVKPTVVTVEPIDKETAPEPEKEETTEQTET